MAKLNSSKPLSSMQRYILETLAHYDRPRPGLGIGLGSGYQPLFIWLYIDQYNMRDLSHAEMCTQGHDPTYPFAKIHRSTFRFLVRAGYIDKYEALSDQYMYCYRITDAGRAAIGNKP